MSQHHQPDGWLDIDQLAAHFGVGRRTVERKISSGVWPSTVLPGTRARRFSPDDVAEIESAATTRRSA